MALRRLSGLYVATVAGVVGVHFVVTPLYHDGSDSYPIWEVLDYFIAAALIVMAVVAIREKMALDREIAGTDGPVTRRYLEVNVLLYVTVGLVVSFFWNWFWTFFPENETGYAAEIHVQMWAFFHPVFVPAAVALGLRLWRGTTRTAQQSAHPSETQHLAGATTEERHVGYYLNVTPAGTKLHHASCVYAQRWSGGTKKGGGWHWFSTIEEVEAFTGGESMRCQICFGATV